MDMCKVSREEEECLFKRPPNLDASMLAIFLLPLIPSKTGAEQDVDELLRRLISDQNLSFLFLEKEHANFLFKSEWIRPKCLERNFYSSDLQI
jgi:hypothetical protein